MHDEEKSRTSISIVHSNQYSTFRWGRWTVENSWVSRGHYSRNRSSQVVQENCGLKPMESGVLYGCSEDYTAESEGVRYSRTTAKPTEFLVSFLSKHGDYEFQSHRPESAVSIALRTTPLPSSYSSLVS